MHPAEADWRARGPEDSEMKGCDKLWTPIRISNHGPDLRAGSHRGGNRVEWESGMWYEGRRSREVREVGVRKQFLFLWGGGDRGSHVISAVSATLVVTFAYKAPVDRTKLYTKGPGHDFSLYNPCNIASLGSA